MGAKIDKKRMKNLTYALIIGLAVVSFWRGAWGIMDSFIFPNDYLLSSIVSLIVGFIVLAFTRRAIREFL